MERIRALLAQAQAVASQAQAYQPLLEAASIESGQRHRLGFASVEVIAAHPGAVKDAALPYAWLVSPDRADRKLGMRRPEY